MYLPFDRDFKYQWKTQFLILMKNLMIFLPIEGEENLI